MGRWFCGNNGLLVGLGMERMWAFLKGVGKCFRIREVLKIFVRCISAFRGSCFRAIVGILSGPGALSFLRVFKMSVISLGLVSGI